MTATLKPCPFCGGTRIGHTIRGKLLCGDCGAEGPRGKSPLERERVWNERVTEESGSNESED